MGNIVPVRRYGRTVWYYHTSYSIIQCMQRSDEENIIHPGAEDLSFVLAHLQSKK
jgi:hypothetical protein